MMTKLMRNLVIWTTAFGAALSTPAAHADDKNQAAETNRLAPLERFVGEWTVHGKWNNGEELQARNVYEWGLGNKIIKSKTFVKSDKREYQRYDAVMAWHPKKKSLFIISFSFDGNMTENLIESKDADTVHIGFSPFHDGEPGKVRQIIQFKDQDHFTWRVLLQNDKDWQEIINATWERTSK
jgi:hypothetical protein